MQSDLTVCPRGSGTRGEWYAKFWQAVYPAGVANPICEKLGRPGISDAFGGASNPASTNAAERASTAILPPFVKVSIIATTTLKERNGFRRSILLGGSLWKRQARCVRQPGSYGLALRLPCCWRDAQHFPNPRLPQRPPRRLPALR